MRFNRGDLVGFGVTFESPEPVYMVYWVGQNNIYVITETGIRNVFSTQDPNDNTGCLYKHGTINDIKQRLINE